MITAKNIKKLVFVFIVSIGLAFCLIKYSILDIEKIKNLNDDFQYNAISMSAIIGGFLFTGIGLLISAIDKERIKRLWENNYLDNLYYSAFVGMVLNVVTIISALIILCATVSDKIFKIILYVELMSLIVGIIFFVWCIKQLFFVITRLKNK